MIDAGILATGNFGPAADKNFRSVSRFSSGTRSRLAIDAWNSGMAGLTAGVSRIIRRDPDETAEDLRAVIKRGSESLHVSWWDKLWLHERDVCA